MTSVKDEYTDDCEPPLGCGGGGCVYCYIGPDRHFMVSVTPWAIYVKGRDFFLEQGGDKAVWGKDWKEVEARSISEARSIAKARWQATAIQEDLERRRRLYGSSTK